MNHELKTRLDILEGLVVWSARTQILLLLFILLLTLWRSC